jgi:type I restriction enzyme S subunit
MINEAWNWRPLGELFEIGAGKTMSAAARDGAFKTPFLRTSNVLWDEIDLTVVDEMAIPEQELATKLLRPGDLLVCEGGEIGRAAIWNGEREVMSFQNHLHRLRPLNGEVEPRFYVYFLQAAFTQLGIFEGAGNKTTIPNLSRNRLASLEVPHPPLTEQQDIATALARVSEAIKTHDRSTAAAQELKHAAMRTLFTRGLRGEAQKETEIGPAPESWEVTALEGHIERPDYGYTASATSDPIGPRFLRITDIQNGGVDWNAVPFCACDQTALDEKRLNPGDIVVARIGATTGKAFLIKEPPEAIFASYLIRIRTRDTSLFAPFLYYYMHGEHYWQHIDRNKGGRLKGGVNIPVLTSLPIPLPPLEEQREIVAILDAIDRKIDLHKKKRAVLDELFKALLHKLMTGEIRVGDLDLSALARPKELEAAE